MMIYLFMAFVLLIVAVLIVVLYPETNVKKEYEMRFEPSNNKYYIVSIHKGKEERLTGKFGLCTIYYEDMIQADYVLQKLKNTND